MRILIAGLIGGIVVFIWSAVAHMVLPIGEMGMRVASGQDEAIAALSAAANQGEGVYMLPGMAPEQWSDDAARQAFIEKYGASPYAFVVYRPDGNPGLSDMTPNLLGQLLSDIVAAVLLAWALALAGLGFGRRVLIAAAAGLFAWLAVNVPYWNWYRFPTAFTVAALIEQVVGWTLAGAAMAWWLGRATKH